MLKVDGEDVVGAVQYALQAHVDTFGNDREGDAGLLAHFEKGYLPAFEIVGPPVDDDGARRLFVIRVFVHEAIDQNGCFETLPRRLSHEVGQGCEDRLRLFPVLLSLAGSASLFLRPDRSEERRVGKECRL